VAEVYHPGRIPRTYALVAATGQGKSIEGGNAMRHLRHSMALSFVPVVFVLGLPGVTHFYIDPGTGSIVLQTIIGGFAAALVAIGMFWKQIKAFVGRLWSRFKHPGPHKDQHNDPA